MVSGSLARRTLFRKLSCRLSVFPAIEIPWGLFLALSLVADAERLELSVQRGPFHADERCGARDVAGKAANLDFQIFPLEGFTRLAQRAAHDRHGGRGSAHCVL